jgi:hypothetical protein
MTPMLRTTRSDVRAGEPSKGAWTRGRIIIYSVKIYYKCISHSFTTLTVDIVKTRRAGGQPCFISVNGVARLITDENKNRCLT